jgi:hypothetical protein
MFPLFLRDLQGGYQVGDTIIISEASVHDKLEGDADEGSLRNIVSSSLSLASL